jgi:4-deoxy-L-threo-5-hexosulose-uronate ketol-isomerase
MTTHCTKRYAVHPADFRSYATQRIREEFLIEKLMENDAIHLVYSHYDRLIVGGAVPVTRSLPLETIDAIKS